MRLGNPPSAHILSQIRVDNDAFWEAAMSHVHAHVLALGTGKFVKALPEVCPMTVLDKDRAFWRLQEVFDHILHRSSTAVNWEALRLVVEAQRQVFASYARGAPLQAPLLQQRNSPHRQNCDA